MSESSFRQPRVLMAMTPGGAPRHFRVQVFNVDGGEWRMYASFSDVDRAERCCEVLTRSGFQVRLLRCDRTPSAA